MDAGKTILVIAGVALVFFLVRKKPSSIGSSVGTAPLSGGLTPVPGQNGVFTDGQGNYYDQNGNPVDQYGNPLQDNSPDSSGDSSGGGGGGGTGSGSGISSGATSSGLGTGMPDITSGLGTGSINNPVIVAAPYGPPSLWGGLGGPLAYQPGLNTTSSGGNAGGGGNTPQGGGVFGPAFGATRTPVKTTARSIASSSPRVNTAGPVGGSFGSTTSTSKPAPNRKPSALGSLHFNGSFE